VCCSGVFQSLWPWIHFLKSGCNQYATSVLGDSNIDWPDEKYTSGHVLFIHFTNSIRRLSAICWSTSPATNKMAESHCTVSIVNSFLTVKMGVQRWRHVIQGSPTLLAPWSLACFACYFGINTCHISVCKCNTNLYISLSL
jgi:hypothetical protein